MSRNQAARSSFSFGLDCLQFLPATPVKDMAITRYCSDFRHLLRTIPAIADIHIDPGFDLEACWYGPSPLPGDNEYIWTETDLEIKMSLHIPSRVQEELKEGLSLETDAQDFHLTIKHGYYAPVAIITSDAESERSSGSSNVYLVRKFLEKILEERKSESFVLDSIGPSPFHADFEIRKLRAGEAADMPVVMTQNVRPGYNEVVWHVDTKQIAL